MDYKELLERYWEGQTTLEEERALKEHFASEGTSTPESVIFGAFAEAAQRSSADTKMFVPNIGRHKKRRVWTIAAAAAAVVMIMATAVLTERRPTVYAYVNGEPVTDYETAYAYTRDALTLLGDNLNTSLQYIGQTN